MDSTLNHLIRNLESRISLFEDDERVLPDSEFIDQHSNWNPGHFFRKALLKAELKVITTADLESIVREFESLNNLNAPLDSLYSKFWLRNVLGYIEIPTSISYAILQFEELKSDLDALRFLKGIQTDQFGKISSDLFDGEIIKYAKANGVAINIESNSLKKYLSKQDSVYKVSHRSYFDHYCDFESEFHFLSFLKRKLSYANQPMCLISKTDFAELLNHSNEDFFTAPSIKDFLKTKVLEDVSDDNFIITGRDYWNYFGNHTASSLFETLASTNQLQRWIDIICAQGWLRDFKLRTSPLHRQRLLELITDKILIEPDLSPSTDEIAKARLDCSRDAISLISSASASSSRSLSDKDTLYETIYKLDRIVEQSNSSLYDIQDSRDNIGLLIRYAMANDGYYNGSQFFYTKKLLDASNDRPFVLYKICEYLIRDYLHIIPHLLSDLKYSRVGLYLISRIKIPAKLTSTSIDETEAKSEQLVNLWTDSFLIFSKCLHSELSREKLEVSELSKCIYEVFLLITRTRLTSIRGFKYQTKFRESNQINTSLHLLSEYLQTTNNGLEICDAIFREIEKILPETNINGVASLPLIKLDLVAKIINVIDGLSMPSPKSTELLKEVIRYFGNVFKESFNKPYESFAPKPIFGNIKQLDKLAWGKVFLIFHKYQSTSAGLADLVFTISSEVLAKEDYQIRFDDSVRFQAERIRAYVSLISSIYREVLVKDQQGIFISRMELYYRDLIDRFTNENFQSNCINVLHPDFEHTYGLDRMRLLPEIIYDLNNFTDSKSRKEIIKILAGRLSFHQLVEVWYFLTSEGDKKLLINLIKSLGLKAIFKDSKWLPDIEFTLHILGWENVFGNETRKIVAEIEKSRDKRFKGIAFQLKLYQYYHSSNLAGVIKLKIPSDLPNNVSSSDFVSEKSLFQALILHKKQKYDEAISILKGLYARKKKSVYAINIFANLLEKGEKENDPIKKRYLINASLDFWKKEKASLNIENSDELGLAVWSNELVAYNLLDDQKDFEAVYQEIPLPHKMTPLLLDLRIQNLKDQGREVEADKLLDKASIYHMQHDNKLPEFLKKLSNDVSPQAQITRLQASYLQILGKQPKELIRLVPEKINPRKDNLTTFLSYELQYCILELIKRIRSINEIKKETKYNDLLTSILQARISMYDWIAKDNPTGNKSGNGNDPGERDLVIQSNKDEIAIIECLHVKGRSKQFIQDHLIKVFGYSNTLIPKFLLCYYKGKQDGFLKSWTKYKNEIFPSTTFEKLYSPKSKNIKSIASNSDAIFLGKSTHGDNHELIHIFINLSFSDQSPNKLKRKTK